MQCRMDRLLSGRNSADNSPLKRNFAMLPSHDLLFILRFGLNEPCRSQLLHHLFQFAKAFLQPGQFSGGR
jgi:hypothetical protein